MNDPMISLNEVDKDSSVPQETLDSFNVPQDRVNNKENLTKFGGTEALMKKLRVDLKVGLTHDQVLQNREIYGDNTFPESPLESYLELLIGALSDGTLLILIAAATVSLVIGALTEPDHGWIEGVAIFIAVFLVSNISAGNDYSKQLQFRALEHSSAKDERTSVLRNGSVERINPSELVVGDIIVLQPGDLIPADAISLENEVFCSNESSLTGEPDDLKKSATKDPFLLSACLLTSGEGAQCRALVIGTGTHSQWGKIKSSLASEIVNTPLQDKLDDMATLIGKIGLVFAIGTFIALIISIWARHNGKDVVGGIINAFIIAVTIVVVAIPEGLPLAVTIALAYSTKKMYQDQCFIRVLAACETMGNATNICSDKTGTLTENRMTVVAGYFADSYYSQADFPKQDLSSFAKELISEHVSVNRNAYLVYKDQEGRTLDRPLIIGNKTEGALMLMIKSWGYDYETINEQVFRPERDDRIFAFNSSKKRSTCVIHKPNNKVRIYSKGASEWIIKDCTHYIDGTGNIHPITPQKRQEFEDQIVSMAKQALRTLCLAHKDIDASELPANWVESPPDNSNLILHCIVGIIDPLRSDVIEAVRIAQEAGVTVRMVTGDNIETASAIAKQCGILTENGLALEGPDFRKMKPKEVDAILPRLQVLARSSPEDKFLLVTRLNGYGIPADKEAWENTFKDRPGVTWEKDRDLLLPGYREEWEESYPEGGQVVGVTGDGTNDAPALKAADVGLAMGITGTKVAQSASDIVILDDKFSSIVKAISWGRSVYDNIRKFLQFQLTVNLVALFLVFIAAILGFDVPLNAVQLLWVNLVMDTMGALALGTELPTPELLQRKPYKRSAMLISRPMMRNIVCQFAFQFTLLMVLLYKGAQWFDVAEGNACKKFDIETDSTLWDPSTGQKDPAGTVGCPTFDDYCDGKGTLCYEDTHTINGVDFKFSDLDDYSDTCLECVKNDYTHYSLIFNAFIFCQVFNEFNSRSIRDDWNVLSGVIFNRVFMAVIIVTIGCQIFLIEVGGEFVKTAPLDVNHFLITVALGAISLPIGILMRFIPVEEDPKSFFENVHADFSKFETVTPLKVEKDLL